MNIQTERLDNHTARFTVTAESLLLEEAKRDAARRLAKRVNIPGFRKGKAPYKVLVQYVGEGVIVEDAIEILGNDIYPKALEETGLDPYGPGELENFTLDPELTFTFVVPLQPEVELADYRSVRLDFQPPIVDDEQVNRALRALQEEHALVEESRQNVQLGNRVSMELYARLLDEHAPLTEKEPVDDETVASSEGDAHQHGEHGLGGTEFIHEHNAVVSLSEEAEEVAPGFRDALLGAALGEERIFELTYPDDPSAYEDMAGKTARFKAKINKIEVVTLPTLTDDFAARVTEKEEKPLTLLELRMRVRENLQHAAEQQATSAFATRVLDEMVNRATVRFPDALLADQIDDYLNRLDREFRRQSLTLDDYMRITGKSREQLGEEYRETAVRNLKRALVLRDVTRAEKIDVPESSIDEQVERMVNSFGEQSAQMRGAIDTPAMRSNIRGDLVEKSVLDRIVAIAMGQAPELPADVAPNTVTSEAIEEGASAQ